MSKPMWEVGTIIVGYDRSAYRTVDIYYYEVVGKTRSGAPKLQPLKQELISHVDHVVDSTSVVCLKLPIEKWGSCVITARWRPSIARYGVKLGISMCCYVARMRMAQHSVCNVMVEPWDAPNTIHQKSV